MFLSGRIICKFAIAIQQGKHYIPKAFSLIPTRSNRQFIRKRSLSETLALAIIWASAHTIVVRAVCTFDSFSFEDFGEPDLVNETKGGSHFRCSRDQSGSKLLVRLNPRHPYDLIREDFEDSDIVYSHSGTGEEKTYGGRALWEIDYNIAEVIEYKMTEADQKIFDDYKQELIDSGDLIKDDV